MTGRVSYETRDGIACIHLDDGKVNVMSTAMLADIAAALDRAEHGAEIVVLRSTRANIFSAGFDLKLFAAGDARRSLEMVRAGAELALRLMSFPLPTVGVMEGHALPDGDIPAAGMRRESCRKGPASHGSERGGHWNCATRFCHRTGAEPPASRLAQPDGHARRDV
jgi:hypothetical protein